MYEENQKLDSLFLKYIHWERFEITQPTLSHHMKILVGCGLVNDRKEGKWHHYSLNCETLMNYKHFIESLTCLGCGDGDCCK